MDKISIAGCIIGVALALFFIFFGLQPTLIENDIDTQEYHHYVLSGFFVDYKINWGIGGYLLHFNNATINGKVFCDISDYTGHNFFDLGNYNLDEFVGNNVTIKYYNDLDSIYPDWNSHKISVIKNMELI